MSRATALRSLYLASLGVVGWDCGYYFRWPASLGAGLVLFWIISGAYLYARSNLGRES